MGTGEINHFHRPLPRLFQAGGMINSTQVFGRLQNFTKDASLSPTESL